MLCDSRQKQSRDRVATRDVADELMCLYDPADARVAEGVAEDSTSQGRWSKGGKTPVSAQLQRSGLVGLCLVPAQML